MVSFICPEERILLRPLYRKADLHVHTPRSTCYSEKGVTPQRIVERAIEAGLDVIAVTDHNTVAAVDEMRLAAEGTALTVLPGVEVTTPEGHVLALFDRDAPAAELEDFLTYAGVMKEWCGDGHFPVELPMDEVFRRVNERGGVAIAAHIERWPSGLLESNRPPKVKAAIHASPYLSALEITIPADKAAWNEGRVRGYPVKRACIQSSDAHSLGEIGRRPVTIGMETIDLPALRKALADFAATVFFPDEALPAEGE